MSTSDTLESSIDGHFLTAANAAEPLRLGLLIPEGKLPAPSVRCIENLLACNYLQLTATIKSEPAATAVPVPAQSVYRLYRWADELASGATTRSLALRDCAALLDGLPCFIADCDTAGETLTPTQLQLDTLRSCRLDVILVLGMVPDPAALAACARCGVWTIRLGDPLLGDRRRQVFWNTFSGAGPLPIFLQAQLSDVPGPLTLAFATVSLANSISTVSNLEGPARVGAGLMLSTLWQLHSAGWRYVLERCAAPAEHATPPREFPANGAMLAWFARKAVTQIRHRIKLRNTREIWRVGIRREANGAGLAAALSSENLTWIDAPEGRYYADPFVVVHGEKSYLFVEDYDFATRKGRASCMQIDARQTPHAAKVVLDLPYHLSYPQVFLHDGEFFMIPETGLNNTVEIYRAVSFPDEWQLVRVLFRGPAFDTTLLQHDGRFWFFVTLIDRSLRQRAAQLMLFFSDTLLGEWQLHPSSPISRDLKFSRCAGAPFRDNGCWIRPTQDCSVIYGGAVHYRRIIEIDTQRYHEQPAGTLRSDGVPGVIGMHTYNRSADLTAMDAKSRVRVAADDARRKTRN